jgi:hypothetical protein
MDIQEVGWGSRDWIYLAAGACEYGNEPSGCIKYVEFLDNLGSASQEEPYSTKLFKTFMCSIMGMEKYSLGTIGLTLLGLQ